MVLADAVTYEDLHIIFKHSFPLTFVVTKLIFGLPLPYA